MEDYPPCKQGTHLTQHGPAWAPKPPKTIQNPTKPHKTNPFQSFPSIPPLAPFTSLLPKQQNRNYSWGMWPLNHTWKITPLANKEPISPNMGQHGPQNPTSSCILLSALFFQCFASFSWWISWNYSKPTLGIEFQYCSWHLGVPPPTYPSELLFLRNYSDKIFPPTHGTPWNN